MTGYYARITEGELEGLKAGTEELEAFLSRMVDDEARCLDIDKSWAGIHFLLCDGAWESASTLFDAVLGGEPLGDEDVGHGPARYLAAGAVARLSEALAAVDFESKRGLFRQAVLGHPEVYPGLEDEEDFNYLEYNFQKLRSFLAECASAGAPVLLFIV